MNSLISKNNTQEVRDDLIRKNVDYRPLQDELLDHIITDVEKLMLDGKKFSEAYQEVKANLDFSHLNLNEVQSNTKMLLDYRSRFLKVLIGSLLCHYIDRLCF